jgi:hypothetical protein
LNHRFPINAESEPVQILVDARDEFRAAAAGIKVLDADPEFSPAALRLGMTQRRRKGVAQVQPAGRRRSKTCDLQDSLHGKGDRGDS